MKNIHSLISDLKSIDTDSHENAAAFEELLEKVVSLKLSDSIGPLLGLLRDNAQHDELMFSIIHGIEIFDDQIYISQILRSAHAIHLESPRWASIIFMRILNSEAARSELVRQLNDSPPDIKAAVKEIMDGINARNVNFLQKTTAIIAATKNLNG